MKLVWKKKKGGAESARKRPRSNPDLPFGVDDEEENPRRLQKPNGGPSDLHAESEPPDFEHLADSLQSQGNKLAEEGMYREALAKWDAALRAAPGNTVLLEQKAQVLLELGEAWGAVKAATKFTQLSMNTSGKPLDGFIAPGNEERILIVDAHCLVGATELDPSWAEAWITLARSQLNYGEPDAAKSSFDKALAIKPDSAEAKADREIAQQLVDKRNQLRSSGSCVREGRLFVVDEAENRS